MKNAKKILASSLLGFIFLSLSIFIIPIETKAAGCAFSCNADGGDINAYCTKLYGEGSRVGTTFVTSGSPDCNMSEKPQCGLTAVAVCCCAPDDSIIAPYNPSTYTANTSGNEPNKPRYELPELQVKIPGLTFSNVSCANKGDGSFICSVSWISDYIGAVYQYALGIGGVLAAVMLMAGGLMWLISGGDASRVSKAKTLITGSITGLIILFTSYAILYQINPELTIFKPLQIRNIAPDTEPLSLAGNLTNSDECSDCVKSTIPVKSAASSMINKDLLAKLETVYQATKGELSWRITEAWPPTQKHKSKCHNNGTCVDIALLSSNNSCANVAKLQQALSSVGFDQILNEYTRCEGQDTTYSSGDHLHIR